MNSSKKHMCPFCPLMGIDPEHYQSIDDDFHGEPAMIGTIRSCADCASVAAMTDSAQELLITLSDYQCAGCATCHQETNRDE